MQYRIDPQSGKVAVPESGYESESRSGKSKASPVSRRMVLVFDHSEFGMTDFAEKINYQRALEGEIARTVMD